MLKPTEGGKTVKTRRKRVNNWENGTLNVLRPYPGRCGTCGPTAQHVGFLEGPSCEPPPGAEPGMVIAIV